MSEHVAHGGYRRLPPFDNDHARTIFLNTLEQLRRRHHFCIFGYVLMPEHVHLLPKRERKLVRHHNPQRTGVPLLFRNLAARRLPP